MFNWKRKNVQAQSEIETLKEDVWKLKNPCPFTVGDSVSLMQGLMADKSKGLVTSVEFKRGVNKYGMDYYDWKIGIILDDPTPYLTTQSFRNVIHSSGKRDVSIDELESKIDDIIDRVGMLENPPKFNKGDQVTFFINEDTNSSGVIIDKYFFADGWRYGIFSCENVTHNSVVEHLIVKYLGKTNEKV